MAEQMKQYISQQPQVWQSILSQQERLLQPVRQLPVQPTRLLLVGSGSSHNAALCARYFIENACGMEVTVVTSTGAQSAAALLPPQDTLALAISQSGRSTNTLAAISALHQKGFYVVSVTANEASPVAALGDAHVLVACGEEAVPPKTKGMTATVLTLYLAGLFICQRAGKHISGMESALLKSMGFAIQAAPENINRSIAFCQAHMAVLAAQPHFTLISDGMGHPVALEDALKVLETLYVPAFAYEFEEYLHGVNNTIAPGCANFILPTHEDNLQRMLSLEEYSRARGCVNFTVSTLPVPAADNTLQLLGSGNPYTAPFEAALFFQILSALGSEAKSIDCDKPKFPDFYAAMGTKANA